MSILDKYVDPGDLINIVGCLPLAAVTVMFMTGQLPPTVEALATFYGGATTAAGALFTLGHYIDKQPICTDRTCTKRVPSLAEQGYK